MAAGKIGSVWADESWPDTAWQAGSWADGITPPIPPTPSVEPAGGGSPRTWNELRDGTKDPTRTRELTKAEAAELWPGSGQSVPTLEDAMLLAMLCVSLDEAD